VFNFPLAEVLGNSLFVPRCGVHGEPVRPWPGVKHGAGKGEELRCDLPMLDFLQSFAILTWVGFSKKCSARQQNEIPNAPEFKE
jgi:hypothetical protein